MADDPKEPARRTERRRNLMVLVVAQVLQWADAGPQAHPVSGLALPLLARG
jgi:hypothetical protein